MSHQTGATILTLSCQIMVFTNVMKFRTEIQMEYMNTPMFHDLNCSGRGASEMTVARNEKTGIIGYGVRTAMGRCTLHGR